MVSLATNLVLTEDHDAAFLTAVESLFEDSDMLNAITRRHAFVVGELTEKLARVVGMPPLKARILGHASHLHDIGKSIIPPSVVMKPGALNPEERAIIEKHSENGAGVLKISQNPNFRLAAGIALLHHELANGAGYPFGLVGLAIPEPVRIVTICDVYEALRSARPYKGTAFA